MVVLPLMGGERWSWRTRLIMGLVVFLSVVLGYCLYGPWILDDGYIIFRYAHNIAEGMGLVYNEGERVLGFSTPLYTLFLAAWHFLGAPLPVVTMIVAGFAAVGLFTLMIYQGIQWKSEAAGWLAVLLLTLHFFWVVMILSGMETTVYTMLTMLTLWAATRHPKAVGILAGLVMWTRYDGVVTAIVALGWVLYRVGWRVAALEALKAFLVYIPWFAFSWVYFGSPIPQTIVAKSVAHYITFGKALEHFHVYVIHQALFFWTVPLFLFGAYDLWHKHRETFVYPIWVIAFAGTFLMNRVPVMFFGWYLVPAIAVYLLVMAKGLVALPSYFQGEKKRWAGWACGAMALLLISFQARGLISQTVLHSNNLVRREDAYQTISLALRELCQPGDSVLAAEIGTMGWFLPEMKIIDGAGLVSPEVTEIRLRDRAREKEQGIPWDRFEHGSPEATRMMIRELKPDFISVKGWYLHIEDVKEEEFFKEQYRQLSGYEFSVLEQWTFVRRELLEERGIKISESIK